MASTSTASPLVIEPVTLEGRTVRLEPLSLDHHAQLCEIGLDEELWRWNAFPVRNPQALRNYIQTALIWQVEGSALPFATVARASGRAIGSTRFGNIDKVNRHVEFGWSWIGRD